MSRGIRDRAAAWLLLMGLLLLWEAGVRITDLPLYILPPPSRVVVTLFVDMRLIGYHAAATVAAVALGLALGTVSGILIAVAGYYVPPLGRALMPWMMASQIVPVFGLAPLLILWLGYGILPKGIVAALLTFFPIAVNVSDGLRSSDQDIIDLLRSLGAPERRILRLVRAPLCLPYLLSGLKVGATLSVAGATIGEWIGASRGLGYFMLQANALLRVDRVFAAVVALTLIGAGLVGAVRLSERHLLSWRRRGRGGTLRG